MATKATGPIRWDEDLNDYLILTLVKGYKAKNVDVPWEHIAKQIHPLMNPTTVQAYVSRVRRKMLDQGKIIPPGPLFDVDRPQAPRVKKPSVDIAPKSSPLAGSENRPRRRATVKPRYNDEDDDSSDHWMGTDPEKGDPEADFEPSPSKKRTTEKAKPKLASPLESKLRAPVDIMDEYGPNDARSEIIKLRLDSGKLSQFLSQGKETQEQQDQEMTETIISPRAPITASSWDDVRAKTFPSADPCRFGASGYVDDDTTSTSFYNEPVDAKNQPNTPSNINFSKRPVYKVNDEFIGHDEPVAIENLKRPEKYYKYSKASPGGRSNAKFMIGPDSDDETPENPNSSTLSDPTPEQNQNADVTSAEQRSEYNSQFVSSATAPPPASMTEIQSGPIGAGDEISPSTSNDSSTLPAFDKIDNNSPDHYEHESHDEDDGMMLESQILDPLTIHGMANSTMAPIEESGEELSPTFPTGFSPFFVNIPGLVGNEDINSIALMGSTDALVNPADLTQFGDAQGMSSYTYFPTAMSDNHNAFTSDPASVDPNVFTSYSTEAVADQNAFTSYPTGTAGDQEPFSPYPTNNAADLEPFPPFPADNPTDEFVFPPYPMEATANHQDLTYSSNFVNELGESLMPTEEELASFDFVGHFAELDAEDLDTFTRETEQGGGGQI